MYTYLDDLAGLPGVGPRAVPRWLRLRRAGALPPIAGGAEPALADPDAVWRPTATDDAPAGPRRPKRGGSRGWVACAAPRDDLA